MLHASSTLMNSTKVQNPRRNSLMQALDADKRMVKVVSLAGLSCEGLASETMVKAQNASSIVG